MQHALRILMLNIEYPPIGGGAAPATSGLARALVARGHEVDVVAMGYRGLPSEAEDGGVRVFRTSGPRRRVEVSRVHELAAYAILARRRAAELVRQTRYDVCHAHFVLPTGLVPFSLRHRPEFPPYVLTSHGSDMPGHNPERFRLLHRVTPPIIRRIVARSSGVLVPSAAMEDLVRAYVRDDRPPITRIANGVDADRFARVQKEPKVLVATRLFEWKGVRPVIEALGALRELGYGLEVAGDGPERPRLERLAAERGVSARFHGWMARAPLDALYAQSRIFVLNSSGDNFPVSLLEAMAAGCAVVTTRVGGCPEVVGDAALVIEPNDPAALQAALGTLLRNPTLAASLGERAARRARECFGWSRIAAEHEQVYACAAGTARVPNSFALAPTA